MATYVIGDIQGCYDELQQLLEQIQFNRDNDKLWFAGDLVNRGPHSLEVLRFVKGLGNRAISVLGNHDLHLLALAEGVDKHQDKRHTLNPILEAPDREELLHWLRHCPLLHHSKKRNVTLVHAGLPPQWDIPTALQRAKEVETVLRGDGFQAFLHKMYGNQPTQWRKDLRRVDRLRFILNCFTRIRYCNADGSLALKEKGIPGSQPPSLLPWFQIPGRASRNDPILFGHWSTLGLIQKSNVWSTDTGCLWGGELTALQLKKSGTPVIHQLNCSGVLRSGK